MNEVINKTKEMLVSKEQIYSREVNVRSLILKKAWMGGGGGVMLNAWRRGVGEFTKPKGLCETKSPKVEDKIEVRHTVER